LALHCKDDGLVPLSQGQHTRDSIAGSRLVTYPTEGHFFAGRFEEVQRAIRAFLADTG
jgi:pimeloyl-ACP methyl ester carboxylesterase